MTILDSNIWIAYAYQEDSQHTKALDLIEKITGEIYIPEYIILEVCTVLLYKKQKQAANSFINAVLHGNSTHIMYTSPETFHDTLSCFQSKDKGSLSFIDIYLLLLSQTNIVITFDNELRKAIKKFSKQKSDS